jgi:hypothetical protein
MVIRPLSVVASLFLVLSDAHAETGSLGQPRSARVSQMDRCVSLPKAIRVTSSSTICGKRPTVVLSGSWKNSFSAAFRWEDGSRKGQDRSPFDLNNGSAFSSPYKSQRRFRNRLTDTLCYGQFLNRAGFPVPKQLTIKRTTAPVVSRFCVTF